MLGETLIHMHFRDAPSTRLFIHLMNFTSRIFIALSFVPKINAYLTRQLRQAALILRSKNKLNKMWCIVT